MPLIRNRWFIAGALLAVVVASSAWFMARDAGAEDVLLTARAKKGEFRVVVKTAGELRAKKFVSVTGPPNAQQAQQYQMKISSIVPEGTNVKEGDIVAELDRAPLGTHMNNITIALTKAEAVHEQASLDTTLNLSKAREDIRTMEFGLEERRLAKEQAAFEAPTIKRQAEIDYEKAERALAQAKMDYVTKTGQAQAKMREVGADLERQRNFMRIAQDVMSGFTVKAPASGMVIYVKDWNGKKRGVGGQVNAWDGAIVATLPDMSVMESQTYVNEIDIRRVAVGQSVLITLDSDPSKQYEGKITEVANVGEQRPNSDAKVFEVKVLLTRSDTTLRPGMTTSNAIETFKIPNALFVPIEAVNADSGGMTVVYKREGTRVVKQEVETGMMSDDEMVILRGLDEGDRVLLAPPQDHDQLQAVRLTGPSLKPKAVSGDTAVGSQLKAPALPSAPPGAAPGTAAKRP